MSSDQEKTEKDKRRRRVNRLKKIILGTILCMILIPVLCAVFLGVRVASLKRQVRELTARLQEYETAASQAGSSSDSSIAKEETQETAEPADGQQKDTGTSEETAQEEPEDETVSVYLTFDDGPSTETNEILDILKEYGVKATFFVIGKTDATSVAAYKRIVEEGHTLGMHSYSHQYAQVYASKEAFEEDLTSLQDYLFSVTGEESNFYRFPGGSSNTICKIPMQDLIQCLEERGITYFDWNVSSGDAASSTLSSEKIVDNVISGINGAHKNYVVLLHDSPAKKTTVEALPEIIEEIQAMEHTQIVPITTDTIPIQHKIE